MALNTSKLSDVQALALTLYGEVRRNDTPGMLAVGGLIRNRMREGQEYTEKEGKAHPLFGSGSLKGVLFQPYQFSCWNTSDPMRVILDNLVANPKKIPKNYLETAKNIIEGKTVDTSEGGTFYYAYDVVYPKWAENMEETAKLGGHRFMKPSNTPMDEFKKQEARLQHKQLRKRLNKGTEVAPEFMGPPSEKEFKREIFRRKAFESIDKQRKFSAEMSTKNTPKLTDTKPFSESVETRPVESNPTTTIPGGMTTEDIIKWNVPPALESSLWGKLQITLNGIVSTCNTITSDTIRKYTKMKKQERNSNCAGVILGL